MVGLLEFFQIINNLKWTERRGWVAKVKVKERESVAAHSYLTAIMSMVIAEERGLNLNKAVKMALIHDIAESITGDYMPEEKTEQVKKTKEMDAMKTLLAKLPPKLRTSYARMWKEYCNQSTPEAKLVHEIDKFDMALQARDYARKGYMSPNLREFFQYAERGIRDEELLMMLKILKKPNP